MKKGIDVSKWQGEIDWKSVAASGVKFVIIRAGYGRVASQVDAQFVKNYEGAVNAGLLVGVYWYSYATTVNAAVQEAKTCLQVLDGRNLDLPVFFDQEYEPSILALSTQARTDIVNAFMNEIKKSSGYTPGLYCSLDFIKNKLYDSKIPAFPRWIAQYDYDGTCDYKGNLYMWQYTSSGKVSGISGNVDMDILYANIADKPVVKKSNEEIAKEVLEGKWDNGSERIKKLKAAGYDYEVVQDIVNKLCKVPAKSNYQIAKEVLAGKWGNGEARKKALKKAGYDYTAIQKLVNSMC